MDRPLQRVQLLRSRKASIQLTSYTRAGCLNLSTVLQRPLLYPLQPPFYDTHDSPPALYQNTILILTYTSIFLSTYSRTAAMDRPSSSRSAGLSPLSNTDPGPFPPHPQHSRPEGRMYSGTSFNPGMGPPTAMPVHSVVNPQYFAHEPQTTANHQNPSSHYAASSSRRSSASSEPSMSTSQSQIQAQTYHFVGNAQQPQQPSASRAPVAPPRNAMPYFPTPSQMVNQQEVYSAQALSLQPQVCANKLLAYSKSRSSKAYSFP